MVISQLESECQANARKRQIMLEISTSCCTERTRPNTLSAFICTCIGAYRAKASVTGHCCKLYDCKNHLHCKMK